MGKLYKIDWVSADVIELEEIGKTYPPPHIPQEPKEDHVEITRNWIIEKWTFWGQLRSVSDMAKELLAAGLDVSKLKGER